MDGINHYEEAECYLFDAIHEERENIVAEAQALTYAQVHATLALAAAVAQSGDLDWTFSSGLPHPPMETPKTN
jgi:hypothetical protein